MTVERICWIAGTITGKRWETAEEWAHKVMGKDQSHRVFLVRAIVVAILCDVLNTSQGEAGRVIGARHRSVIGRLLARARRWRTESPQNEVLWGRIEKEVLDTIAAETAAAARPN